MAWAELRKLCQLSLNFCDALHHTKISPVLIALHSLVYVRGNLDGILFLVSVFTLERSLVPEPCEACLYFLDLRYTEHHGCPTLGMDLPLEFQDRALEVDRHTLTEA